MPQLRVRTSLFAIQGWGVRHHCSLAEPGLYLSDSGGPGLDSRSPDVHWRAAMGFFMGGCVADFFTYETTKSVVVKSWSVGIINRIVQMFIITYFVGSVVLAFIFCAGLWFLLSFSFGFWNFSCGMMGSSKLLYTPHQLYPPCYYVILHICHVTLGNPYNRL